MPSLRKRHASTWNAVFCDGSVHVLSYNMSWRRIKHLPPAPPATRRTRSNIERLAAGTSPALSSVASENLQIHGGIVWPMGGGRCIVDRLVPKRVDRGSVFYGWATDGIAGGSE